jgi:DNA ligase-associated metallophosphoesterase
MTSRARVTIAGETLELLAAPAIHWPRLATLFVADPHCGKAATFRAAAVPAPRGTTEEALRRLDRAISAVDATRVVFLGDFLHAREGRAPATLATLNRWRAQHSAIEMVLVRGNHDKRAGDPPAELAIACVDAPMIEAPFAFAHHPRAVPEQYVLAGHVHPGARLAGAGRDRVRLPCFWFGAEIAVLPAFGEFTGLADIDPALGDRVWVVADDAVVEVAVGALDER